MLLALAGKGENGVADLAGSLVDAADNGDGGLGGRRAAEDVFDGQAEGGVEGAGDARGRWWFQGGEDGGAAVPRCRGLVVRVWKRRVDDVVAGQT